MAREGKLTALKVRALKDVGRYGDGGGLMLVIGKDGSRKWVLRLQASGKRRDFGLGSANDVSLKDAREEADRLRRMVRAGVDPVAERKRQSEAVPTFREAAERVHAEHSPAWKNPKHAAQWLASLGYYAFPHFGERSVSDIDSGMIRDALAQIWLTIPETARRVRQRIGTVLDWAHAKGYRPNEAPMRAVTRGLPKQPRKDNHFAAMPWQDVPAFLDNLRETDKASPVVRLAFEFLILTAARSGEVRGARWDEIDVDARLWRIPAERMKAGRAHVVPLSEGALGVLEAARKLRLSDGAQALIFPGERRGQPLSDMTLTMLLRRIGAGCTAHGFRSSFRDWAAEATPFPSEVAEAALAHTVKNRVEAAYRRSDLLEKRRAMMQAWGSLVIGANTKFLDSRRVAARDYEFTSAP